MSTLFDEQEADAYVEEVLNKHGKKTMIITEQNTPMKIVLYKDQDGIIKQAINFEPVTREDIVDSIRYHHQQFARFSTALEEFDQLAAEQEQGITT